MERTIRRVKAATQRLLVFFAFLLLFSASASTLTAKEGESFIVVEKVERLSVYNKYQQEASETERQTISPFAPMRILRANDLFGDGFTRCMQVEVETNIFYLLQDGTGNLKSSGSLGFTRTFRNAVPLFDTIEVLKDNSLQFFPNAAANPEQVRSHQKFVRFFRQQNMSYCLNLNSTGYGWMDFTGREEGKGWKFYKGTSPSGPSIPPGLLQKIQARTNEVNEVLTQLFEYFNNQTHQQKKPPRWNVESSTEAITCTLVGSLPPEDFEQSTLYLFRDIENMTLGANLQVSHFPGKIEIRKGKR